MDAITGTSGLGEGSNGVPVVDLTALLRDVYQAAERARERRALLLRLVAQAERDAAYLDSVADTLAGVTHG